MVRPKQESTRERNGSSAGDLNTPQVLFSGNGNGGESRNGQLVLPAKPTESPRVSRLSTDLIRPSSAYYLDQAVYGQVYTLAIARLWEEKRDLTESSLKTAYAKLIGELLELMVAVAEGKSPAQCLAELGDVYAYSLKMLMILFDRIGVEILPTVSETLPAYEQMIHRAKAEQNIDYYLPNRLTISDIYELIWLVTEVVAVSSGNKINLAKYNLAINKLNAILANPASYHKTPDGGRETTKQTEKLVSALFLNCFEVLLNGHFDVANAASAVPELLQSIRQLAQENFEYSYMDELVALFYLYKNAINYPIGVAREIIRKVRDLFPGSIINPNFSSAEEMFAYYGPYLRRAEMAELAALQNIHWPLKGAETQSLARLRNGYSNQQSALVGALPEGLEIR